MNDVTRAAARATIRTVFFLMNPRTPPDLFSFFLSPCMSGRSRENAMNFICQ